MPYETKFDPKFGTVMGDRFKGQRAQEKEELSNVINDSLQEFVGQPFSADIIREKLKAVTSHPILAVVNHPDIYKEFKVESILDRETWRMHINVTPLTPRARHILDNCGLLNQAKDARDANSDKD